MTLYREILKLRDDTLKVNGKYSIKRLAVITAFYVGVCYAFMPLWKPLFVVHEFVFWGFITFSGTGLGMTVWNKKIDNEKQTNDAES